MFGKLLDAIRGGRSVYLVVYHREVSAREGPAHWAIWIPHRNAAEFGKLIHVVGDTRVMGFRVQFRHHAQVTFTDRRYDLILLDDDVSSRLIVDKPQYEVREPSYTEKRQQPVDDMERYALAIPAPPLTPDGGTFAGDCQTWIWQVVTSLVDNGVLKQSALAALEDVSTV
ncbi:hypothetical protein DACRYDRAFT_23449 [Dacryopinax primogenitus]|uniref:Uncharacterized protein n=1 Tax=Dacryopinax primogenitus (strain DJM 731) TaxID=1858805 RepID=M5FUI5_DACPD|nr:uncharacterized protein DACRYDRAFT_23449 [Dacryopinax primogenitus]EJT99898.1 hypothetical protein DACRYDRAFT_23449 [Dacryopinax primogenitus]